MCVCVCTDIRPLGGHWLWLWLTNPIPIINQSTSSSSSFSTLKYHYIRINSFPIFTPLIFWLPPPRVIFHSSSPQPLLLLPLLPFLIFWFWFWFWFWFISLFLCFFVLIIEKKHPIQSYDCLLLIVLLLILKNYEFNS